MKCSELLVGIYVHLPVWGHLANFLRTLEVGDSAFAHFSARSPLFPLPSQQVSSSGRRLPEGSTIEQVYATSDTSRPAFVHPIAQVRILILSVLMVFIVLILILIIFISIGLHLVVIIMIIATFALRRSTEVLDFGDSAPVPPD